MNHSKWIAKCAGYVLVATFSLAPAHSSRAEEKNQEKHHHPCKADREKFCAGKEWGKGLGKCLKEHKTELSGECKARLEKRREHREEMREKK